MIRRVLTLLAMMLASLSLIATLCYGQAATATITGTVVDQQGAVISGATVVAKKIDTGTERTTKTTSDGIYRFDSLAPGLYDVRVDMRGFGRREANGVKLQIGEMRDVNFTLSASGTTEKITVTASPLVETTKTDVSTVVDDKQVATLPTTTSFNGLSGVANDYAALAATAPGVKYDFTSVSSDLIGPGAVNDRSIQVNLDGGNISDQVVSARDALGASVEEVKEFQVLTNNYNAEYGQAGGIILNVITKSGTNGFHGDGHYYTRGRNLTASTFFYNQGDAAPFRRAPFHKYEGGFTAGGPFIKDKTFWFVSYEQVHQGTPLTLVPPQGTTTISQPTKELLYSFKVNHQLNEKNQITGRFNVQRDISDNLLVQIANFASPDSLVASVVHDHNLNLSLVSTMTANTVNEARFFWHRFLSQTPTKSDAPGLSGPNFYHGAAFCCPQGALQNRYQWVDNFSWTHGVHSVKAGVNISHFPYFSLFTQIHDGEYIFTTPEAPGAPAVPPGPAVQFQIGLGPAQVTSSDNIYGFYGQDTWKIRPNLTLNYGIRYDLEVGAFKGGTIPNSSAGGCFQANGIIPGCSSDHNNFQPRVGIAWSPNFEKGFLYKLFGDQDNTVIRASFGEVTELAFLNVVLDSLNFDGVNLLTVASSSPGVLGFAPNLPPANVLESLRPAGFFGRVRPISNDLRNPETRHVNLTISRQIGKSFLLDVTYLGVFGFGLFGERDRNFPPVIADPAHPGFFYFGDRNDPRFTAVRTNENSRTSAYNGLIIHGNKRLSHHFQVQGGYTYSKLLASTEDFFGASEPGDPNNIRLDRALAQADVRNQVSFGAVFDTENVFSHRVIKHIFNNWTVGVIGQLQSGRPYPVSTGDFPFSGSAFFGIGNETSQRPNVLADGTLVTTNIASRGGTNLLVGPSGAAACNCPQTTFLAPKGASPLGAVDLFTGDIVDFQFLNGDLIRNAGHSSPYYRFDMSFIKAFRIIPSKEQMRLEFKVDVFNIFNRPNFLLNNTNDDLNILPVGLRADGTADPNCTSCLNAFTGKYIGANGQPLRIQDLQKGRVSKSLQAPVFGGIGDPAATDIARTIQLSVRFRW